MFNKEVILASLDPSEIEKHYNKGYLAGRKLRNYFYLARSIRVDLAHFSPSSENRRILKKYDWKINKISLPLLEDKYDWRISKLGKDFYETNFPDAKFTANKFKQLLTEEDWHFNRLIYFTEESEFNGGSDVNSGNGFAICLETDNILHYSYPFYKQEFVRTGLGMYMMLQSILYSQLSGKKYIYLGGSSRQSDLYKLQFKGVEWFDENTFQWNQDSEILKQLLKK